MDNNGTLDIFSLFEESRTVTLTDHHQRSVTVLLMKPSWRLRELAYERYEQARLAERVRLESIQYGTIIREQLRMMTKSELVQEILTDLKSTRQRYLDIYPVVDESASTPEQRKQKQQEVMEAWVVTERAKLETQSEELLLDQMVKIAVERKSLLEGVRQMNFFQLSQTCFDPNTKAMIFKTPEDLQRIPDASVVDRLVSELASLMVIQAGQPETVREASETGAFLDSGGSPSPSTSSPPTTSGPST